MKDIVIIGAGGHAKVIADILIQRKAKLNEENLNILGFLDDDEAKFKNTRILGIPYLGKISTVQTMSSEFFFIIGIGNNKTRKAIYERFPNLQYYTAIHPTAVLGEDVEIGDGTVVMAHVVVNTGTKIGNHAILNTGSIIEHDNVISDFVHVSPGSVLCGEVMVGESTWIGANSVVIQGIRIGENVVVGAGTVMVNNQEDGSSIVGNPGKPIHNGQGK
jgi:sugar O-acyltransferase (sialic acid O-acetyltransferase NeuD family)